MPGANISLQEKPVIRRELESPRNETGVFSTWKRQLETANMREWSDGRHRSRLPQPFRAWLTRFSQCGALPIPSWTVGSAASALVKPPRPAGVFGSGPARGSRRVPLISNGAGSTPTVRCFDCVRSRICMPSWPRSTSPVPSVTASAVSSSSVRMDRMPRRSARSARKHSTCVVGEPSSAESNALPKRRPARSTRRTELASQHPKGRGPVGAAQNLCDRTAGARQVHGAIQRPVTL